MKNRRSSHNIRFEIEEEYYGTGISRGLQRGVLAYHDGDLIVGEGMGIGICAMQQDGFTYFSSIERVERNENIITATYKIDKKLQRSIWGFKSTALTMLLEFVATNLYMKNEKFQNLLFRIGSFLRRVFKVDVSFEHVVCMAKVDAVYDIGDDEVGVSISCNSNNERFKLFIMNEFGGSIFNSGMRSGNVCSPPSGWRRIDDDCELYSPARGLRFTLNEERVPEGVKSKLYWGREVARGYDWAGFESILLAENGIVDGYKYKISFRKAGDMY